jgi:hypothetical protein
MSSRLPISFAWHRALAAALIAGAGIPAWSAEPAVQPSAPVRGGEPEVKQIVQEDDNTRIEELRVRGETQRIVVQSKVAGAPAYEIVPGNAGRGVAGAAGQRVWHLFSF